MNEIILKTLEGSLTYEKTVILTYKISYPEIVFSEYEHGKNVFNMYNRMQAYKLENYSKNELYKDAVEVYKYNKENGYPIMVYEVVVEPNITYNNYNILSLYTDEYIYTGGAHGSTIRRAQNWNLKLGKMFKLNSLYPNNPYYIIDILKEINKQIKQQIEDGNNQYFDDYCNLVLESFKLENFYLSPQYVNIFFQQYDIAPYSSGIPVFKIAL